MKSLQAIVFVLIAAMLASCSPVTVLSDTKDETDFSKFKTYSFLGWQADSEQELDKEDKDIIYAAFEKEFTARGMSFVPTGGDVDVSLFIVFNKNTAVSRYNKYTGSAHGAYDLYDTGWGYGATNTRYSQRSYRVGTLIMDVFDGKKKKQIWQGTINSKVMEKRERRATTIPKKVAMLMKEFPKSKQ
jgi:hypothetical protein